MLKTGMRMSMISAQSTHKESSRESKEHLEHRAATILQDALETMVGATPPLSSLWDVLQGPDSEDKNLVHRSLVRYVLSQKSEMHKVIFALTLSGMDWSDVRLVVDGHGTGSILHYIVTQYWSLTNNADPVKSVIYLLNILDPDERTSMRQTAMDIIMSKESFDVGNPEIEYTDKRFALREMAFDIEFASLLLRKGAQIPEGFISTLLRTRTTLLGWIKDNKDNTIFTTECDLILVHFIKPLLEQIEQRFHVCVQPAEYPFPDEIFPSMEYIRSLKSIQIEMPNYREMCQTFMENMRKAEFPDSVVKRPIILGTLKQDDNLLLAVVGKIARYGADINIAFKSGDVWICLCSLMFG